MKPVIVCTEKRAVVFGYAKKAAPNKKGQIILENARMCLYWPAEIGGVFGLSDIGPNSDTRVSAEVPGVLLEGVTSVFTPTPEAVIAWLNAPVQGRN